MGIPAAAARSFSWLAWPNSQENTYLFTFTANQTMGKVLLSHWFAQRHIIPIDFIGFVDWDDYLVGFPKTTFWRYIQIELCCQVIILLSNSLEYGGVINCWKAVPLRTRLYHFLVFVGGSIRILWAVWIWSATSTAVKAGRRPRTGSPLFERQIFWFGLFARPDDLAFDSS